MTVPTVPVSVWEQIPVIVIFALLLAGIGWFFVRSFTNAVSDINKYYSTIIEKSNDQWQRYFDARSQSNDLINKQVVEKLEKLTAVIETMYDSFSAHDLMERQALDEMASKRRPLSGKKT